MNEKTKNRIRYILSFSVIFILIPLALSACVFLNEKYIAYIVSVIVVLSLIPFFLITENRKLRAREIVPIAIMTAAAAASRAAFYFIPQFKPIVAVVIITGVAFGMEAGFLCGSLSMLCSNFFFGHGPWTPWQMFALGLIGFLSGIAGKSRLFNKVWALALFGAVCGFLYGVIVDSWTVLAFNEGLTLKSALSIYVFGAFFTITLSVATALFIVILAEPLLAALKRVKFKYGLIQTAAERQNDASIDDFKQRPLSGFETENRAAEVI